MHDLTQKEVCRYLEAIFAAPVTMLSLGVLGDPDSKDVKALGYGVPLKVDFQLNGQERNAVGVVFSSRCFSARRFQRCWSPNLFGFDV